MLVLESAAAVPVPSEMPVAEEPVVRGRRSQPMTFKCIWEQRRKKEWSRRSCNCLSGAECEKGMGHYSLKKSEPHCDVSASSTVWFASDGWSV